MATRTVTLRITGSSKELQAALAEAGLSADEASTSIGDHLAGASDKAAGGFSKVGNAIQNFTGIPVGAAADSISQKFGQMDTSGQNFTSTMSTLGGVTLAAGAVGFAAVGVEAVKLASSFQSTVTSIAANAGIPVAAAQKIGQAFLGTAGTTIFSGQQIGQAYAAVAGQLGAVQGHALDSAQAMTVMKAAMDLAEGSGTDLNTATSVLAATMQAFGDKASQAGQVSDVLFNTSRVLGVGVSAVGAEFTKLHSTLGATTPSLGQLGGILIDLTEHGETGRKALAAINTSLNGLLVPTKSAAAAQAMLGVSFVNSSGQFIGMSGLISELQPKLEGMTQVQQLAALKAIGMGTANKALLTTILSGPDAYDKAAAAAGRMGTAHDAAEKQSQTLDHQMELLKATALDLGTQFGQFLIPKLEDLAKVGVGVINFFEKNKGVAEALAAVIGTVLGGAVATFALKKAVDFGQAIAGMGKSMIALATTTLEKFGIIEGAEAGLATESEATGVAMDTALGPIGLVLAGITVAALLLKSHWKQIWDAVKEVVSDVVNFIKEHWELITEILLAPIAPVISLWLRFHDQITGFISDAVDFVKTHWELIVEILTGPVGMAVAAWQHFHDQIVGFFDDNWHDIDHVWSTVENDTMGTVDKVVGFFTALPGRIVGGLGNVAGMIGNAFLSAVSAVDDNVITPVLNFFEKLPGDIMKALGELASDFLHLGEDIAKAIINGLGDVGGKIWDAIKSHIPGGGVIGGALSAIGLAEGGIVTKPTLAIIGEAGYPEAVIPLKNGITATPEGVGSLSQLGAGNSPGLTTLGAGNGGGVTTGASAVDSGGGDLVLQMNGKEVARAAGEDFRSWLGGRSRGVGGIKVIPTR